MARGWTRRRWAALSALLLLAVLFTTTRAQTAITLNNETAVSHFPESLSFAINAASSDGDIQSATLYYRFRGSNNWTRQVVEVEPAGEVALSYDWDTSNVTVVPSSPIYYYWDVADSAGNRQQSEESLVYYDDIRYDWQILEDDYIAVWWHDRPSAFGQRVFDIAQRAFSEQYGLFGVAPEYQIRIIIYNDFDEFAGWHSYLSEFIGGQAFPGMGITTQLVTAYDSETSWLNDVVPHEISHLYLYQASYHPLSSVPAWLDEGLAQYNEFDFDGERVLASTQQRILDGELIPLWSLSGSFGYEEEKVRLAYDEAYSAVTYLVDAYGEEGMTQLLAAYRDGLTDDAAFPQALERTLDEFELDWLAWQGVPLEMYPTRTPEPAMAWPTNPPMAALPTNIPTETPTATMTVTASATKPSAVAEAATNTPTSSRSDVAAEPPAVATPEGDQAGSGGLPCLSGLLPAALFFMVFRQTGRRPKSGRKRAPHL
jgi:hypothetical protein